ncbi:hypothetical protein F8M41_004650 [Gigaspora margarita]|uniref:F-box domain-containing protein n=1 Tax=Gigaspora margarita TaxID=4874 RepID=A0A8H3XC05_GIGMA|nr:hypothetical protein F8M41_004650 [Gigaspora margarita]
MVIPPLPDDTIIDILEYLQDDRGSLYNCLFINRFWCQRVVRLLWRQPFYIPIERCSSLLHTYFMCFNDEEQRSLIPFNIALQSYKQPMFLYSSYLAELDSFFIDRAIIYFLYKEESPRYFIHVSEGVNFIYDHSQTEDYYRIRQLTSTFWHMLLRSCVKVNYLGLGSLDREPIHYTDVPQIFLNSKSIFSHIKKLYLNPLMSQNSITFLKHVPSICSNIRKLVFHELKIHTNDYPQIIINIIKAQPKIEDLDFLSFKKYESLYISLHNISINHLDCLVNFANRCTTLREVGLEDIQDQSQYNNEKLDVIDKLRQLNIKIVPFY